MARFAIIQFLKVNCLRSQACLDCRFQYPLHFDVITTFHLLLNIKIINNNIMQFNDFKLFLIFGSDQFDQLLLIKRVIWRQVLYFIIQLSPISIMSQLVTRYAELRDRIKIGSISITSQNYPFSAFCLGYLMAKTQLPIQLLFDLMQILDELNKMKLFSIIFVKKTLQAVEDFPSEGQKIVDTLKEIKKGQGRNIDIANWIESFYLDEPLGNGRIQQTQSLEPISRQIKNDGTLDLQDIFEQHDNNNRRRQEELDIEMARKMQQQFNLQQKKPKNEQEDVPCEICYVNLFEDTVQTLDCGHLFHKNCLAQSFKSNIISNSFPLKCPNDDCKLSVSQNDLKVILSKEMFQKYQKHTLKAYADQHGDSISWCPTANCGYMFFYQKDDEQRFQCLQCHKEYCLNCRVEWHQDMSCKEYKISSTMSEDDEKFMSFVKGKKFKQCPKCKFWVQKNQGCDHMTCKCKFQFCYKCGGIYMKCQCVENARIQMERRRLQIEERNRRKMQRKNELLRKREEKKKDQQLKKAEKQKREDQKPDRRSRRKR